MKRLTLLVLIALLTALVPVTALAKGPAAKGTGGISIYEPWDGGHREVSFNAHEGDPAKGEMVDYVYGPDGELRRVFKYTVYAVNVEDDTVYFGAYCWYDSEGAQTGQYLYVKAYDGGTPGTAGDAIGWRWGSQSAVTSWVNNDGATGWWRGAIAGNLVVHNK